MKSKLCALILLIVTTTANTFGQTWLWANSAGEIDNDVAYSVSADAAGNTVSVGDFYGATITFGSNMLFNGGPVGQPDMFIVKCDAAGNVLWANSAGGVYEDRASSVTTDAFGNIIVTGSFRSATITFGSITLTNAGGGVNCMGGCADMYIVKYDAAGNVLWANSTGGTLYDIGTSIATDTAGNIIVSGQFNSQTITFGATTLTNTGSFDIFIVKYDAAGNVLWARSAIGSGHDYGRLTVDDSGNIIAAGSYFSPTLTFGTTTLTNSGSWDFYIAKYDTAGNVLWAKSAGGPLSDGSASLTADASGNIISTGTFDSPAITFGSITLSNPGMFIVKYSAAGNVLWAKSISGAVGNFITADVSGNLIAACTFRNPTISIGTTTLTNADNSGNTTDLFIVKYDTSGNILWVNSAGGTNSDAVVSIATDASGNIIAVGLFYSPTISFGSTTLTNAAGVWYTYDLFIAKMDITTGVYEMTNDEVPFAIYPNPSNGMINIEFNLDGQKENQLILMNSMGQVVCSQNVISNQVGKAQLDISALSSGIYFLKAGKEVKKFVKE